jgi:excisionase family DNA binding protein
MMSDADPAEELRRLYPTILTTAHVAEMLHCTIGDVRDKVHAGTLPAMRWGQQFRFFRDEVIAAMHRVDSSEIEKDVDEDEPDEEQA